MESSIAERLNALNREFYESFADPFADSRTTLQPGIARAIARLAPFDSLLDLGCGDGRVGRALREGRMPGLPEPWRGRYVGIDACGSLLRTAAAAAPDRSMEWIHADATDPEWARHEGLTSATFDAAALFSFLHHIPSAASRARVLQDVAALLAPGGPCAVSVWQIRHLDRFRKRVVPWGAIGLTDSDVEPGDLLLDWRRGGTGLRYVHEFTVEELVALAEAAGFETIESFRSDGHTGDLGLYWIGRTGSGSRTVGR